MSNSFYNHGAFPSTGSAATSASMRAELDLVAAGFDKMPTLAGNANKFIIVNSTGTGLTQTDVLPAFTVTDTDFTVQDDGDNTRKFQFNAGSITTGNTRVYVMPDLDTTLVGTNVTQTLTNKTLTAPVIATIVNTGTLTLPTSTDTLVGRNTTDTLTNKTLTNPVIGTIVNTGTLTLPTSTDTLVGRQTTDTLTNKTISGASNTLSNIANGSLSNSSIVIGSTTLSLGGTMTTLAGVTISGASNTLSNIANASLTNSSITINGSTVALGSSVTVTATATNALTIGNGLSGTSYNGSSAVTIAINTGVTADLSTAQTFSNKTISGSANTLTNIANASLTNSAITIGSTAISLGATSLTLAGLTSASATTLISTGNQATSVAISAIGHSSGTVTVTTSTAHGLTTGDTASIDGVADYTFCGVYTVTVTNANVFTYSQTASGASSSGGFSTKLSGTWGLYAGGTGPSLANGPVMINASSQLPALRVTQGGSGYALIVEDAANPDTSAFIISNAGDLAINTNKFTVAAASGNTLVAGTLDATGNFNVNTNKFTVAAASGNTVIGGTTSFGGNIVSNVLFTDATYDIGATGANRPRDLFLSRNLVVGGTLTLAGGVNLNGNVTIGDASTDTLTITSTITSNLIFTDNTYDIGASGATRPRSIFIAANGTFGGQLGVNGSAVDSNFGVSATNGFKSVGNSKGLRLLNTNTDGGGTIYANSGAGAGITIGADAGPLALQGGGSTGLTVLADQTTKLTAAQSTVGQLVIQNTTTRANGNKYGIRFSDSSTETNASIYVTSLNSGNNQATLTIAVNNATGGTGIAGNADTLFISPYAVGVNATPTAGAQLFVQSLANTDAKSYVGAATGTHAAYQTYVNTYVTTIGNEGVTPGNLAVGSTAYYSILNSVSQGIQFATANTVRATVDTSGNWFYNTTPSAWSGMTAAEWANGQGLSFSGARGYVNGNAYWDGTSWKRKVAGYATQYNFDYTSGLHLFNYAVYNATPGSNIAWVNGTTMGQGGLLTNYGNIVVGTSSTASSYIGVADGQSTATDARFLLSNGSSTYAALRMVFNSTSSVSMDAVLQSSSATQKDLLINVNGGGVTINSSAPTSGASLSLGRPLSFQGGTTNNRINWNGNYISFAPYTASVPVIEFRGSSGYAPRMDFYASNDSTITASINADPGVATFGASGPASVFERLRLVSGSNQIGGAMGIPIFGSPNLGTYKGYILLNKTYAGSVGQVASRVTGTFVMSRGSAASGNRVDTINVSAQTAYNSECCIVDTKSISPGNNNPYEGDYVARIVKLTYGGVQYFALETSVGGGNPDVGVWFNGSSENAGIMYVDATYVSSITTYRKLSQVVTNDNIVFNGNGNFSYKYGSTTGVTTVANGATATLCTLDTTDQNASYLLFVGQAGAGNAGIRAYAYIKQGGSVASIYVIETSGGINSLSMSGLNVQFTNGAGGSLGADWTLVKINGGGNYY